MKTIKTDFLVIGSGIAGLSYALKTAKSLPEKQIIVICKSEAKETNTRYAQGGIAVGVKTKTDSPEKHISDTLKAGDGLCNKQTVELVIKEGQKRLKELIENGVKFDRNIAGAYDLAIEGGHSTKRVYHKGDYTGLEIERKLLAQVKKQKNIRIIEYATAIDLITNTHVVGNKNAEKKTCYGAYVLLQRKKKTVAILSAITVLATGGIGQVFNHTTNSCIATGDGIAMAYRAGAEIKNMAFIQFHPTAVYDKNVGRDFLISEALRGFGAILRNADGEDFMRCYSPDGNLATRDIAARAIKNELITSSSESVFLDCRHISKKDMVKHFPTILSRCTTLNINPSKDMIPVVPSAHYCCGGIATDINGRTTLANLYACGECAETGLHGANRLASNSLLEALVFAHQCSVGSIKKFKSITLPDAVKNFELNYVSEQETLDLNKLIETVKKTVSESVSVTTTHLKIRQGLKELKQISEQIKPQKNKGINLSLITLTNIMDIAFLILEDCAKKTKNAGTFYNIDLAVNNSKTPITKAATNLI